MRSYRGGVTTSPRSVPMLLLWALTGTACVVSVLGILTIGVFVAPVALALLALSVVLTMRRPDRWPSVAGVGVALAFAIGWIGLVLSRADPSTGSCSATPDGAVTCVSEGRVLVPGGFATAVAAPWFAAAAVVLVATVAAYLAASTRVRDAGVGT